MTTSNKIKNFYRHELVKAKTIDELAWIDSEYKQNMDLTCDDLLYLCRFSDDKKYDLESAGQKYTMARRPSWR